MSLKNFEFAKVEEGWLAELARGYLVVSEVANYPHGMQLLAIRRPLEVYAAMHEGIVHAVFGSMECKILVPKFESERHPDIAVYLTAPMGPTDRTMWRTWLPELVVEVVSESSRERDYIHKREEYWGRGIKEYWIVDAELEQVLLLRRGRSDWIERALGPQDTIESKLLPGFRISCRSIFAAGRKREKEA
jgi:Uma2 family endonuclease